MAVVNISSTQAMYQSIQMRNKNISQRITKIIVIKNCELINHIINAESIGNIRKITKFIKTFIFMINIKIYNLIVVLIFKRAI
jgi:hypothetical protein